MHLVALAIGKLIVGVAAIAAVVYGWYNFAEIIVKLLDFNLGMIKMASAQLPKPYGAMTESALRGALAADKALLFAEATGAIKLMLYTISLPFRAKAKPHT